MPDPEQNRGNRRLPRRKNVAVDGRDLEQGRCGGGMTGIVLRGLTPAEDAVALPLLLAAAAEILEQDGGDALVGAELGPAGGHIGGGKPEGQRHPGQQTQDNTGQRRSAPSGPAAKPDPSPFAPPHAARPLWFRPLIRPAFRVGKLVVVEEDAVGGPIEILKLPALERPQEAREADQPQPQRRAHQIDQFRHSDSPPGRRSGSVARR